MSNNNTAFAPTTHTANALAANILKAWKQSKYSQVIELLATKVNRDEILETLLVVSDEVTVSQRYKLLERIGVHDDSAVLDIFGMGCASGAGNLAVP